MQPIIQDMRADMKLIRLTEDRFRTCRLSGVFAVPLRESTAAEYAILPGLLTRCNRHLPTVRELNRKLDSLYGADISGSVFRLGQWQMLVFSVSFLRQKYTLSGEDLTEECTRLLAEMLFEPLLEGKAFREADFRQEQRCLLERVQSEINNKRAYARHQCEKLLCPDDPYSVDPHGTLDTVNALTPAVAAEARERLLSTARIHWILQGDTDADPVKILESRFDSLPYRQPVSMRENVSFTVKESSLTEKMAVKQAKLVLGLRVAATEPDGPVAAVRLMNTLLGGCPTSLLFQHVREEQSLCYYCSSGYDRFHGVILIDCGVEYENADKAKAEILRQLEAIRQGDFSGEELEAARRSLIQRFSSMDETPADREMFYISQTVYDLYTTPEETANQLLDVTKEDVCHAAGLVHFDSTYLLCPASASNAD